MRVIAADFVIFVLLRYFLTFSILEHFEIKMQASACNIGLVILFNFYVSRSTRVIYSIMHIKCEYSFVKRMLNYTIGYYKNYICSCLIVKY